jgi:PPP family 3-phenylpropionic acid transporter
MVAGIGALVRWTCTAMAETVPALAVLQVLHALTFGAAHLAAMQYIARAIPIERSATAQALYGALATGMCTALAMMVAGAAYERLHAGAYFAMAAMALAGTGLALLLAGRERTEPLPADA